MPQTVTQKTKTRTYGVLIAVALSALFVDRFLLGGHPVSVEASAEDRANAAVDKVLALTPTGLSIPELPFPRNLPDTADAPPSRDIFAFPTAPQPDSDGQAEGERKGKGAPVLSDASTFATRNHLEAVLSNNAFQVAVVNGLWMRTGQTLDACTLVRIEGTRAYFECPDGTPVLDLAGKPATKRRPR